MGTEAGSLGRGRAGVAVALALAALLATLAIGCGGDDDDSGGGGDARALLEQAVSKRVESADVRMRVDADVPGFPILGSVLHLDVDGPVAAGGDGELPTLDWDALLTAGGQELPARVRVVDGGAYVTFQGLDYEADPKLVERLGAMRADDGAQDGFALLGLLRVDPTDWLTDLRVEDGEEIGGDATRTVTGIVDVEAVLDDLVDAAESSELRERVEALGHAGSLDRLSDDARDELVGAIERADVAIAIDDDGYARGVAATLEFTVPEDVEGAQVEGGTIELEVVLEQLDVDVDVRPPPNPAPLSDLLRLGGLIFGVEELSDLWTDPTP